MGNIQKRPNGKWRARYRDHSNKEHARHFERKIDAQNWLDTVTASKVRGDYIDPKGGLIKLADYADNWYSRQLSRPNTLRNLRMHIDVLRESPIGSMAIKSITRGDVQKYVKELSLRKRQRGEGTFKPGTVKVYYTTLSSIMSSAVDDRLIPTTPCRKITLPKATGNNSEVIPPSPEEVSDLLSALGPAWGRLGAFLAGSGLRIGEALGLTVGDWDESSRTLRITKQRLANGDIGPTKTGESRNLPIGEELTKLLQAGTLGRNSYEPLFMFEGEPVTYNMWIAQMRKATIKASLDLTTHDLRHFCASALISGGASVKQVQTFLGHASASTTLSTYAHLWPGDDDRTRKILDAVLTDVLSADYPDPL